MNTYCNQCRHRSGRAAAVLRTTSVGLRASELAGGKLQRAGAFHCAARSESEFVTSFGIDFPLEARFITASHPDYVQSYQLNPSTP